MIPKLPSFPEGNQPIASITPDWLRALWRCVEYAMYHPTGDGKTIFRNGELLTGIGGSGGSKIDGAGEFYNGPFALLLDSENQITVKAGFALRNGKMLDVPQTVIAAANGFICCRCQFDEKANDWKAPDIVIADAPAGGDYPIGKCTIEESGQILLESFRTPVAVIIVSKQCPLAVQNG
ncbi:MAG: hypothetical protein J6W00_10885 [Lentisphaeria bacterium]|nr:hypothetical protein [Lentisphaeria bacterium]